MAFAEALRVLRRIGCVQEVPVQFGEEYTCAVTVRWATRGLFELVKFGDAVVSTVDVITAASDLFQHNVLQAFVLRVLRELVDRLHDSAERREDVDKTLVLFGGAARIIECHDDVADKLDDGDDVANRVAGYWEHRS